MPLVVLVPRRGFRMHRAWPALALAALAACASAAWSYSKPGTTPARLDQDLEACRRAAHDPHAFALSRGGRIDRDAVNHCMERKGYTAHRDR